MSGLNQFPAKEPRGFPLRQFKSVSLRHKYYIKEESEMTVRDKLYYEIRINKLVNNGKENGKIVKKLQRKLRSLENEQ